VSARVSMCVCVCVCVCVCGNDVMSRALCVWERVWERVCVREFVRECVMTCIRGCTYEPMIAYVYVCVCAEMVHCNELSV